MFIGVNSKCAHQVRPPPRALARGQVSQDGVAALLKDARVLVESGNLGLEPLAHGWGD